MTSSSPLSSLRNGWYGVVGLVLLAGGGHQGEPLGPVAKLLDDARLADAGVPDQLDEASEAHAHRHERGVEDGQLALAVDERQLLRGLALPRARHLAHRHRVDGLRLPLQGQRPDRPGGEEGARALEEVGRRPDRARVGFGHQPRGERGRAAENRERLAVGRPDTACEDVARGDADVQREPGFGVDRGPHGAQQALLVLAGGRRHARDEDDPPADRVDVAFEEADAVRRGRVLEGVDDLLDRLGVQRLSFSAEPDEGHRRLAVLALDAPGDQVGAERLGNAAEDVEPGGVGQLGDAGERDRRREGEQRARSLAVAEGLGGELSRGRVAHRDLAGLGRVLHLDGDDGVGAGDDQLAVAAADEEEVEVAAVDADVHPQLDGADRGLERAERGKRVAHSPGRSAGPSRVGSPSKNRRSASPPSLTSPPPSS